jgi:hypothetical protein
MRLFLISILVMAWAGDCLAGVEVAVYSDPDAQVKCLSSVAWPGFQIIEANVVVTGDVAISSVSFSANVHDFGGLPSCGSVLAWLGDSNIFPLTSGTSPAGVQIDFGDCLAPPIHALTIFIMSQGLEACCLWCVEAAQAVDCTGQGVPVTVSCTRVVPGSCDFSVPTDPLPPDGAESVPLDATLSWTSTAARGCSLGDFLGYTLYFGTTADPPMVGYDVGSPFDPGDLAPGVLYYWQVLAWQSGYGSKLGPLWTFRTAGTVPAEGATWGRIKALYQ